MSVGVNTLFFIEVKIRVSLGVNTLFFFFEVEIRVSIGVNTLFLD